MRETPSPTWSTVPTLFILSLSSKPASSRLRRDVTSEGLRSMMALVRESRDVGRQQALLHVREQRRDAVVVHAVADRDPDATDQLGVDRDRELHLLAELLADRLRQPFDLVV